MTEVDRLPAHLDPAATLLAPNPRHFHDPEGVREPQGRRLVRARVDPAPSLGDGAPGPSHMRVVTTRPAASHAGGRHQRTVWTIPTQLRCGAHFATFPERLIEPFVLAETSQTGCCPSCDVPWQRVVEVTYTNPGGRRTNGPRSRERWRETPGFLVVLHPFAGSGTTLAVTAAIGGSAIGIELKRTQVELRKRRLSQPPQHRSAPEDAA